VQFGVMSTRQLDSVVDQAHPALVQRIGIPGTQTKPAEAGFECVRIAASLFRTAGFALGRDSNPLAWLIADIDQ